MFFFKNHHFLKDQKMIEVGSKISWQKPAGLRGASKEALPGDPHTSSAVLDSAVAAFKRRRCFRLAEVLRDPPWLTQDPRGSPDISDTQNHPVEAAAQIRGVDEPPRDASTVSEMPRIFSRSRFHGAGSRTLA